MQIVLNSSYLCATNDIPLAAYPKVVSVVSSPPSHTPVRGVHRGAHGGALGLGPVLSLNLAGMFAQVSPQWK